MTENNKRLLQKNYLIENHHLDADCINEPLNLKELLARIKSVLQRYANDSMLSTYDNSWQDGNLFVDFDQNYVSVGGQSINLTPSEMRILCALANHPRKIFTRAELIEITFGADFDSYDRVIDTHIKNLRRKIKDNPKCPKYVLTIRGFGYKFGGGNTTGARELPELNNPEIFANRIAESLNQQISLRKWLIADILRDLHELHAPLSAVSTQLKMMIDGARPQTTEHLQCCLGEIKRIAGLVEGIENLGNKETKH